MKRTDHRPLTTGRHRLDRLCWSRAGRLLFALNTIAVAAACNDNEVLTTLEACERYVDAQHECIESAFTAPEHMDDVETALRSLATTCDFHQDFDADWLARWFLCLARAAEMAECDDPESVQEVGQQQLACKF